MSFANLFADKQIGIIPSFVKDKSDVVFVYILENDVPVLIVREEREGFISTIMEYFVIYGKEKLGPFDDVNDLKFSPDGKTLAYSAEIDGKEYNKVFFDSKVYTGSICWSKVVYIKDGKIMLKE